MLFNVTLDRDEDGMWVVECPSIPGCFSQGKTRVEAMENIRDAIRLCREVRAERGMSLGLEEVAIGVDDIEAPESEGGPEPPDRATQLSQVRGIWRDRTDLPDWEALRGELDRP